MTHLNKLKDKTSQMGFSELKALRSLAIEGYDYQIDTSNSKEDIKGLESERDRFNTTITDIIYNKVFVFLGD